MQEITPKFPQQPWGIQLSKAVPFALSQVLILGSVCFLLRIWIFTDNFQPVNLSLCFFLIIANANRALAPSQAPACITSFNCKFMEVRTVDLANVTYEETEAHGRQVTS